MVRSLWIGPSLLLLGLTSNLLGQAVPKSPYVGTAPAVQQSVPESPYAGTVPAVRQPAANTTSPFGPQTKKMPEVEQPPMPEPMPMPAVKKSPMPMRAVKKSVPVGQKAPVSSASKKPRYVVVGMPGQAPQRCLVVRQWVRKDGKRVTEYKALATGEVFRLVGGSSNKTSSVPTQSADKVISAIPTPSEIKIPVPTKPVSSWDKTSPSSTSSWKRGQVVSQPMNSWKRPATGAKTVLTPVPMPSPTPIVAPQVKPVVQPRKVVSSVPAPRAKKQWPPAHSSGLTPRSTPAIPRPIPSHPEVRPLHWQNRSVQVKRAEPVPATRPGHNQNVGQPMRAIPLSSKRKPAPKKVAQPPVRSMPKASKGSPVSVQPSRGKTEAQSVTRSTVVTPKTTTRSEVETRIVPVLPESKRWGPRILRSKNRTLRTRVSPSVTEKVTRVPPEGRRLPDGSIIVEERIISGDAPNAKPLRAVPLTKRVLSGRSSSKKSYSNLVNKAPTIQSPPTVSRHAVKPLVEKSDGGLLGRVSGWFGRSKPSRPAPRPVTLNRDPSLNRFTAGKLTPKPGVRPNKNLPIVRDPSELYKSNTVKKPDLKPLRTAPKPSSDYSKYTATKLTPKTGSSSSKKYVASKLTAKPRNLPIVSDLWKSRKAKEARKPVVKKRDPRYSKYTTTQLKPNASILRSRKNLPVVSDSQVLTKSRLENIKKQTASTDWRSTSRSVKSPEPKEEKRTLRDRIQKRPLITKLPRAKKTKVDPLKDPAAKPVKVEPKKEVKTPAPAVVQPPEVVEKKTPEVQLPKVVKKEAPKKAPVVTLPPPPPGPIGTAYPEPPRPILPESPKPGADVEIVAKPEKKEPVRQVVNTSTPPAPPAPPASSAPVAPVAPPAAQADNNPPGTASVRAAGAPTYIPVPIVTVPDVRRVPKLPRVSPPQAPQLNRRVHGQMANMPGGRPPSGMANAFTQPGRSQPIPSESPANMGNVAQNSWSLPGQGAPMTPPGGYPGMGQMSRTPVGGYRIPPHASVAGGSRPPMPPMMAPNPGQMAGAGAPRGYPTAPMGGYPMTPQMQQQMQQQMMMQQMAMQRAMMQGGRPMQQMQMPTQMPVQMTRPMQAQSQQGGSNVRRLLTTLQNADFPSMREWAADELSKLPAQQHPEAVATLALAAKTDPAGVVRAGCVRALEKMGARSASIVDVIQSLQSDKDPRARLAASQALQSMGIMPETKSDIRPAGGTK